MNVHYMLIIYFALSCFSQHVEMEITNIQNAKGCIRVAIFRSDEDFKKEIPVKEFVFNKVGIKNGKMTVKFEWKEGRYGFALLDDENEDGKMNYNFLGVPKEGYGFSNYEHTGLTKPSFSNFAVDIKHGLNKVKVNMQYIF